MLATYLVGLKHFPILLISGALPLHPRGEAYERGRSVEAREAGVPEVLLM